MRRRTVLIVDDNAVDRRLMRRELEGAGLELDIIEAANVHDALARIESAELVITDLIMPGPAHGLDVVRRAVQLGRHVVVVSSYAKLLTPDLPRTDKDHLPRLGSLVWKLLRVETAGAVAA